MSDELAALTARLQRLEDLQEIRQLFVDYGHYLDRKDFASFATLFAREGEVLLGAMARAKGPEAIRAAMESALGGRAEPSFHVIGNPIIELDGDTAKSETPWVVVRQDADGKPVVPSIGRHKDVLIREDGRWRILRRAGYVDIPAPAKKG